MNPNLEVQVRLLQSDNGYRQSIRWRTCRWSNRSWMREIAISTWSRPTDRSKPIEISTGKSAKSTKIQLKLPLKSLTMKSTGLCPKRTSNDTYQYKQHRLIYTTSRWELTEKYSTKHCTKAQESSIAVLLVKYNNSGGASILDVDKWDKTTKHIIDLYNCWLPMATNIASCGSSHRCQVTGGISTTLMIPTKSYA